MLYVINNGFNQTNYKALIGKFYPLNAPPGYAAVRHLLPEQVKIIQNMQRTGGVLLVWPEDLTMEDLNSLIFLGIITRKTYGRATYAHTEYRLA